MSGQRGLGDVLALALYRFGITKKPGCGCDERQALLNRLFPFRRVNQ